jgi:beta-lactam-binding protein with PASTA domain
MPFDTLRAGPVRQRVWSAGRLLILAVALLATYGLSFLAAIRVANHAREVKVPDLRGQSVAAATDLLTDAGLVLKVDPQRRSDAKVPADHVLSQEPDPGTVLRLQRAVRVRVSDGQKDPEIPSVIGQTERTAEITLAQNHITLGSRAEIQTADYPAETIIAQDPPGKDRGTSVSVLVNRGGAGLTYVMPDLIGTLGTQVQTLLRKRNFRVTIVAEVAYPGLAPGVVVQQTPRAGFQLAPGDAISLEVVGR